MTEKTEHPTASHSMFPYFFADAGTEDHLTTNRVHGFDFTTLVIEFIPYAAPIWINDLAIFYGQGLDTEYIDCRCSRWDVQDYSVTVETWLYKDNVDTLMENIRPGAVRELYKILGKPHFVDSSWQGYNTLRLYPTPSSQKMNNSTLHRMRRNQIIYPKTITIHPIRNSQWIETKIEGYISGNTL